MFIFQYNFIKYLWPSASGLEVHDKMLKSKYIYHINAITYAYRVQNYMANNVYCTS